MISIVYYSQRALSFVVYSHIMDHVIRNAKSAPHPTILTNAWWTIANLCNGSRKFCKHLISTYSVDAILAEVFRYAVVSKLGTVYFEPLVKEEDEGDENTTTTTNTTSFSPSPTLPTSPFTSTSSFSASSGLSKVRIPSPLPNPPPVIGTVHPLIDPQFFTDVANPMWQPQENSSSSSFPSSSDSHSVPFSSSSTSLPSASSYSTPTTPFSSSSSSPSSSSSSLFTSPSLYLPSSPLPAPTRILVPTSIPKKTISFLFYVITYSLRAICLSTKFPKSFLPLFGWICCLFKHTTSLHLLRDLISIFFRVQHHLNLLYVCPFCCFRLFAFFLIVLFLICCPYLSIHLFLHLS